jgi:hypothetical protein
MVGEVLLPLLVKCRDGVTRRQHVPQHAPLVVTRLGHHRERLSAVMTSRL